MAVLPLSISGFGSSELIFDKALVLLRLELCCEECSGSVKSDMSYSRTRFGRRYEWLVNLAIFAATGSCEDAASTQCTHSHINILM